MGELFTENLFGITATCFIIGVLLKRSSKISNETIPAICGICGGVLAIILYIVILDSDTSYLFKAIGEGILAGLSATGVKELTKSMKIKL